MTYRAKKPRKRRLTVKVQKMWYVSVVDETESEVENDYCFGTREEALRQGNILKRVLEEATDAHPTAGIFWGMNNIGGAK